MCVEPKPHHNRLDFYNQFLYQIIRRFQGVVNAGRVNFISLWLADINEGRCECDGHGVVDEVCHHESNVPAIPTM